MFREKKGMIPITVCFIVLHATSFALAKPSEGLVGHWSFDEGSGEVANDASSEKNHGELWGEAKWAKEGIGKSGQQGTSVEFPLLGRVH